MCYDRTLSSEAITMREFVKDVSEVVLDLVNPIGLPIVPILAITVLLVAISSILLQP